MIPAKIFVTGPTTFNDLGFLFRVMDSILIKYKHKSSLTFLTMRKPGVESRAMIYARTNEINVKVFNPKFFEYGSKAIEESYALIAKEATHCICFYNKIDMEPQRIIDFCDAHGIKKKLIQYNSVVDWANAQTLNFTFDEL